MPIWLLYAAPAVILAGVFVLVARRMFHKADEAAKMRGLVLRLELTEAKQKRDADKAGAAL